MRGGTRYSFRDVESFAADQDADILYSPDIPLRKIERENWGGFLQDQIHVSAGIQLLLGLRYEYFSATREAEDRATILDPATLSASPAHGAFYRASKSGFQPRAAFTWSPAAAKGNSVFRIGAGIYNGPNALLETLAPIQNSEPRLVLPGSIFPLKSRDLLASPDTVVQLKGFDAGTFGLPQRNILITASFQQILPHRLVGEVAYVGSYSRHLTQLGLANLSTAVDPLVGVTIRPNSRYAEIPFLVNGGNSSYQALQLCLDRQLVDNLTMRVSYNFSHSIGDTQGSGDAQFPGNAFCLRCERSNNDFDIRHTVSVNVVYAFPFGKGNPHLKEGWLGLLLGGWTVAGIGSVRSGLPVNVVLDRSDEIYYDRGTQRYY